MGWKTQKFWFFILNVSICLTFSCFTVFNTFSSLSKIDIDNFSEKSVENDDKSTTHTEAFFIHELPFELSLLLNNNKAKNLVHTKFTLPSFYCSPSSPPPDLPLYQHASKS